jgi:5'-methylthioadenosine phosphorylase
MVMNIIKKNTDYVKDALIHLAENPPQEDPGCDCQDALAGAIITNPAVIPPETRQRVDLLVSKYLEG